MLTRRNRVATAKAAAIITTERLGTGIHEASQTGFESQSFAWLYGLNPMAAILTCPEAFEPFYGVYSTKKGAS